MGIVEIINDHCVTEISTPSRVNLNMHDLLSGISPEAAYFETKLKELVMSGVELSLTGTSLLQQFCTIVNKRPRSRHVSEKFMSKAMSDITNRSHYYDSLEAADIFRHVAGTNEKDIDLVVVNTNLEVLKGYLEEYNPEVTQDDSGTGLRLLRMDLGGTDITIFEENNPISYRVSPCTSLDAIRGKLKIENGELVAIFDEYSMNLLKDGFLLQILDWESLIDNPNKAKSVVARFIRHAGTVKCGGAPISIHIEDNQKSLNFMLNNMACAFRDKLIPYDGKSMVIAREVHIGLSTNLRDDSKIYKSLVDQAWQLAENNILRIPKNVAFNREYKGPQLKFVGG